MTKLAPAEYNWPRLQFRNRLLGSNRYTKGRAGDKIRFVVVHHMTIVGKGTGSANDACFGVWQTRKASAHYGVDGKHVAQFVWDSNTAWATGSTAGNRGGISIEHANSTAGPRWEVSGETWRTGARLAAHLHKVYKLGRPTSANGGKGGTLRKHSSFKATACPGPYMDSIWSAYVREAQRVYDEITAPAKPAPTPAQSTKPAPGKLWFELGSWNIALGNKKGIQNWVSRRAGVAAKIRRENPAVLCLQEAYLALENGTPALTWLEQNLPDHRRVVTRSGRAILVRNDVKVVASGVFDLLTRAPGQPKKYATWAHLIIDGAPAFIVNAHAQHGANRYKTREKWVVELASLATRQRQILGIPATNTFFAGDWNGKQGRTLLGKRGYTDAVANAIKATNSGMKTLNSWKRGLVKGARIDYLMVEKTRPIAAFAQSDDSALADHNYQSFQISRYKK